MKNNYGSRKDIMIRKIMKGGTEFLFQVIDGSSRIKWS